MTRQYLAAGIGRPGQYTRVFSGFALEPYLNAVRSPEVMRRYGLRADDIVAGTIARTNSTLDSVSVSTSTDSGGSPLYSATVKIETPMPFLKLFKLTTASQTLRSDVVAPKRIITTSFRPVHAQGAYAKDIFVWTRNAAGAITWTQDVLTYRYGVSGSGTNPAIGNTTLDFTVPDHASFGVGVKVYEDLTYKGGLVNPKILYSDVDSSKFRQSGDCAKSPGMRINVEDGGDTNYLDFQYDMLCSYVLSKDKVRLAK